MPPPKWRQAAALPPSDRGEPIELGSPSPSSGFGECVLVRRDQESRARDQVGELTDARAKALCPACLPARLQDESGQAWCEWSDVAASSHR
jgi:hypothetical protein